jgi:GT2 family glycosyltransferase
MLVRRLAIERVGLLDESFFFCGEETDWCRRFKQAGWKVRFAPVGEIIHWGGASGQSLSYRRDMLLSEGLVRYHRKHNGIIGAVAAYAILWVFNFSRLGFWSMNSLLMRNSLAAPRRKHFSALVRNFGQAWARTPIL